MMRNIETLAKHSSFGHEGVNMVRDDESGAMMVSYCPGNGNQYKLLFQKLPEVICSAMGAPEGAWQVTDLNHTLRYMVVAEGNNAHLNYVTEKLESSAVKVQTAMINVMVGDLWYGERLLESIRDSRRAG
jgi:hypothetical protein